MIKIFNKNSNELVSFLKEHGMNVEKNMFFNNDIISRLYMHINGDMVIISDSLVDIRNDFSLEVNADAEEFYSFFGFILPPYTIYQDTFSLAPYVCFSLIEPNKHCFNLPKKIKLNTSLELIESIRNDLNEYLSSHSEEYSALFSAGIDSSVLLSLADSAAKVKVAINCHMESMGEESEKAKSMCHSKGIDFLEIHLPKDLSSFADRFLNDIGEPISDQIAVVMPALLEYANADKSIAILDGQGADSLFSGLPHDKVCTFYCKNSLLINVLSLFRNIPVWKNKSTKIGRILYRGTKALNCLSQPKLTMMLMTSLLENGSLDQLKQNSIYMAMHNELESLHTELKDFHLVIRYFFMFRMLYSREMQKYLVCQNEGYKFCLPFIETNFVSKYFYTPSSLSIVNNTFKWPMFKLATELWPTEFKKSSTSPFQVEFSVGNKNVKDLSMHKLTDS